MNIFYTAITDSDFEAWFTLAAKLWDDHDPEELKNSLSGILRAGNQSVFLAKTPDGNSIGFINVSVRVDYVEGAENSPTGYLEGIYVEPEFRKQRVASQLLQFAEKWLLERGCRQIGSDVSQNNTISQEFHKNLGFGEEAVLIHFLKNINK